MPAPIHLLERAYQLINANQIQNAELLLDAVVRVDPQNIKAWKTYLMIHQNQTDLDWLKDRIVKTRELSETDKAKLLNYHLLLTKQLNGAMEVSARTEPFTFPLYEETETTDSLINATPQLELIDMFDYPTRIINNEMRTKPRRRAIYNPFAFLVTGILETVSRIPLGEKLALYIQQTVIQVKDLVKNPQDVYARLSKSPNFDKYSEVGLLLLFVLGLRLVTSNNFLGYGVLGLFVFGGRWWLIKFGNHSTTNPGSQSRVYLHENKVSLPEIKEINQEQKPDKEKS